MHIGASVSSRSSDWNINRAPLQCEGGGSANNCTTVFCYASANIKGLYISGRSADVFNTAALCWSVFAAVLYLSKITYPRVEHDDLAKDQSAINTGPSPSLHLAEILGHKHAGVKYLQFLLPI